MTSGAADKPDQASAQDYSGLPPSGQSADTDADGDTTLSRPVQPPFETLAHYEVGERIGQGGMGDVYKGYEPALDRTVAIKVLPAELSRQEDFVRRFQAEATVAAKLDHPNTIKVYFVGEDAGHHFFVMQFVDGESLGERIAREKTFNVDATLDCIEQVLAGLSAAHQAGLVHRDVKPGNILLDAQQQRALVADFGLVKSHSATTMTATGVVMGTVDYISPEQGCGHRVDGRSDLYAVGVMMYEMLSGRLPFAADSPTAMIFQHVYQPPQPLSAIVESVSEPVTAIVARLMAKSPDARYSSAEEVLADIRACRAGDALPSGADRIPLEEYGRPVSSPGQSGSASVDAGTLLIEAPAFERAPETANEQEHPATQSRWEQFKRRLRDVLQSQAPEFLQRLQTTQQQMDGAVLEYQRRRDRLNDLIETAQEAVSELENQRQGWLTARDRAQQAADEAVELSEKHRAEDEARKCQTIADDLAEQTGHQREHVETMRGHLAKVVATLERVTSQRDVLNARLKAAQAQFQLAGGRIATQRWRRTVVVSRVLILTLLRSLPWPVVAGVAVILVALALVGRMAASWLAMLDTGNPQPPTAGQRLPVSPPSWQVTPPDAEEQIPLRQLRAHQDRVNSLVFASDGRLVSMGKGAIYHWDIDAGATTPARETMGPFHDAVLIPGTQQFVAHIQSLTPYVNGIQLHSFETGAAAGDLTDIGSLGRLTLRSDGKVIASVQNDATDVFLWDVETQKELPRIAIPDFTPLFAEFSPAGNGQLLAVGGEVGQLHLWNTRTDEVENTWSFDDEANVVAIRFRPDGAIAAVVLKMAVPGRLDSVSVVDVESGDELLNVTGQYSVSAPAMSFHPDGRSLAIHRDNAIQVYDIQDGSIRKAYVHEGVTAVAYAPDGKHLVSGDHKGVIYVWDAKVPPLRIIDNHAIPADLPNVTAVGQSADGLKLATGSDVVTWDPETMSEVSRRQGPAKVMALTKDGSLAASIQEYTGIVTVWNTVTGTMLHQTTIRLAKATDHSVLQTHMSFLSDGTGLVIVRPKTHHLWDFEVGGVTEARRNHSSDPLKASVTPDGTIVATSGFDTSSIEFKLWDTDTGDELLEFQDLTSGPWSLAMSPDGQRLASGGHDGVDVWDVRTGEKLQHFDVGLPSLSTNARSLDFSADGRYLVSGGNLVDIHDTSTGERVLTLVKPAIDLLGAKPLWSPDGNWLATREGLWKLDYRKSTRGSNQTYLTVVPFEREPLSPVTRTDENGP